MNRIKAPRAFKISEIGLILVSVPLVCELLFVVTLAFLIHQAESETQRELRAREISEKANVAIVQIMRNLGSLQQYYKSSTTKAEENHWLAECGDADKQARAAFYRLHQLLSNDEQRALAHDTERLYTASSAQIKRLYNFDTHDLGTVHAIEMYGDRKQLNDNFYEMLSKLNQLLQEVQNTEQESPEKQSTYRHLVVIALFTAVLFNVFLAVALAKYFGQVIVHRLSTINENTVRLSKGVALAQPLAGDDEIANVDHVFHEMADKLKEADRMKKEFVSMLSHDLRTPLTSLQALLTLLESGVLGEQTDKARHRILGAEDDIGRLIGLINDLLDVEKLEAGRFDLDIQEVDLANVIERSSQSVRSFAEKRNISIKIENARPELITADGDRLVQVVVNILSNAIKFSADGSSIEISVEPHRSFVEVRIKDHGRGIPAGMKDLIFDRFQQVEVNDAKQKGGTGLGLAICKMIIEQHGGSIGLESEEGHGCTFWFRLPRVQAAKESEPARAIG